VTSLADQLRTIVRSPAGAGLVRRGASVGAEIARPAVDAAARDAGGVLGGEWREDAHGTCLVVERRVDGSTTHGRRRVGEFATSLRESAGDAPMLAGGALTRPPFIFFDLETTGLSGGAGTHAFLVGCGWFDDEDGFVTRQYLMTRYADERSMLGTVAAELARAGALVTFNGKSFDAPVLETRYLFHRLEWTVASVPHLDVLQPARAFWGSARGDADGSERGAPAGAEVARPFNARPSCSLGALEQQQLGAQRRGDVPGFEIPARYFQFVRSGDARPLAAVLEHNRQDLLSLAGLTSRLVDLVRAGADAARDPREALALGRVYARAGLDARAHDAYECALRLNGTSILSNPSITIDALRALACASRRARQYDVAADYWQRVLDVRGCPLSVAREASEALAIHHEHRLRDLDQAKRFALRSLEIGLQNTWVEAGRHRLARIERKIECRRSSVASPRPIDSLDLGLVAGD
jgi:uncharacterized protein